MQSESSIFAGRQQGGPHICGCGISLTIVSGGVPSLVGLCIFGRRIRYTAPHGLKESIGGAYLSTQGRDMRRFLFQVTAVDFLATPDRIKVMIMSGITTKPLGKDYEYQA